MATVIDRFIVSLGLDSSAFKHGADEGGHSLEQLRSKVGNVGSELKRLQIEQMKTAAEIKKGAPGAEESYHKITIEIAKAKEEEVKLQRQIVHTTEEFQHQAHKAKETFSEITVVAKELLGVAGIGLAVHSFVGFIEQTVEAAVGVSRLSKEAHIGVEEVQAWQSVVLKFGGTAEGVSSSIEQLGMKVAVLGTKLRGAKMATLALAQIGLTEVQVKGKATGEVLEMVADKLRGMEYYKAKKMTSMLGISDPGLIRAMVQGGEELEKALAGAKKNALNEEEIHAMHEYHESLIDIQKAFTNLKKHIVADIVPALKVLAEYTAKFAQFVRDHRKEVEAALIGIASAFAILGTQAMIAGIKAAAAWIGITGPVALVVAGIAAIAAGLVWVGMKFKEWQEGGISAFGAVFDYIANGVASLKEIFSDLGSIFKDVWDLIIGLLTGDDAKVISALEKLSKDIMDIFDTLMGWVEYEFWILYETIAKALKNLPKLMKEGMITSLTDQLKGISGETLLKLMPGGMGRLISPVMANQFESLKNPILPSSLTKTNNTNATFTGPVTIQTQADAERIYVEGLSTGQLPGLTKQIAGGF